MEEAGVTEGNIVVEDLEPLNGSSKSFVSDRETQDLMKQEKQ